MHFICAPEKENYAIVLKIAMMIFDYKIIRIRDYLLVLPLMNKNSFFPPGLESNQEGRSLLPMHDTCVLNIL